MASTTGRHGKGQPGPESKQEFIDGGQKWQDRCSCPFTVRDVTCIIMIPWLFTTLKYDGGSEKQFSIMRENCSEIMREKERTSELLPPQSRSF